MQKNTTRSYACVIALAISVSASPSTLALTGDHADCNSPTRHNHPIVRPARSKICARSLRQTARESRAKKSTTAAGKEFVIYDAMLYGQPDAAEFGIIKLSCFDDTVFRPPGKKGPNQYFLEGKLPNKAKFMSVVRQHAAENPGPIVLDFEHIPLNGDRKIVEARVKLFVTMAEWAKEAAPGRLVGYWGERRGNRLYPRPPGRRRDAKRLANAVTAFFPNLYVYNTKEDRDSFRKEMKAVLKAAHKVAPGKPVFPFLWPQVAGPGLWDDRKYFSGDFWRFQLETAKECGADGVVLWGYWGADRKYQWKKNVPWWLETIKFAKTLRNQGNKSQKQSHRTR